jgi:hypothetical protein
MPRTAQEDRVVPVTGQRRNRDQACGNARLEELPVPLAVSGTNQHAGIAARDDLGNAALHPLEGLPVAPGRQSIAAVTVGIVVLRVPVAGANSRKPCRSTRSAFGGICFALRS